MLIFDSATGPYRRVMDNSLLCELVHPANIQTDLNIGYSLAHVFVLAGETTLPHLLKESVEVYYIIRGQGMMHIDGETSPVKAGQAVVIPSGSVQYISTTGESDLEFLAIVHPMWEAADEVTLSPEETGIETKG